MDDYIIGTLALIVVVLVFGYVPLIWSKKKQEKACAPCTAKRIDECLILLRRILERLDRAGG